MIQVLCQNVLLHDMHDFFVNTHFRKKTEEKCIFYGLNDIQLDDICQFQNAKI